MYKGQKWIKKQRDKHSFFMSFTCRIGYSFIKNVKCIFENKTTVWWPFISNSKHQQKEKIRKLFSILSDNTNITSYAVFICIMINLF